MERSQFTFYESFFRAASRIKDKADRAEVYDAICAYALYGTEPDLDSLSESAAIAFELSKPNLDASRRKASSGKKGGEVKQTASSEEANASKPKAKTSKPKQTASKKEKENKKEKEIENKCYNPLTPLQEEKFSPNLLAAVKTWVKYKHERKEDYKPVGLEAMTTEIQNKAKQYGDAAVIEVINLCMAQNWKGIIWDKISAKKDLPVGKTVDDSDMQRYVARMHQRLREDGMG